MTSTGSGTGSPLSSLTASVTSWQYRSKPTAAMWPDWVGAEQVAGAADLEVAHRDPEPGAELGELADRLQPLVGLLGEGLVLRVQQVRVGPLAAATDPAPQLVQLGEPEPVGAVDDQRVHGGDVEAALDDGGADQHVVLAFPEVEHDPLEAGLVHLAVRDPDPGVGDQVAEVLGGELDVLDPVVDEEHLALAEQLAADRLPDRPVVVLADVGEDRLAVLGRGGHHRQVADPGQGQLQGAGDRRRRQGEHVDARPAAP